MPTTNRAYRSFALVVVTALACGDDAGGGAEGDASSTSATGPTSDGSSSLSTSTATSTPTGPDDTADTSSSASSTGPAGCEDGEVGVRGTVTRDDTSPIEGARITVFTDDFAVFVEVRSAADGSWAVDMLAPGSYRVGASLRDLAYVEAEVQIADGCTQQDFALGPETEPGRWTVIGDTAPEFFAGTPSATVLPDGRVLYCHDTQDPVIVDPADGSKSYPSESPSSQGCHMQTVLSDGRVLFVGGQDPEDPGSFVNGIPYVKAYDPVADAWEVWPELNEPRWYPMLVRLPDETLIACGGGQPPDASRTDTCERLDLATRQWSMTGSMVNPTEYSPAVLLFTGEVLATWSPPQLFDPVSETWTPTGDFVQPNRLWPGHSDHSLVLSRDGSAIAVGVRDAAGSEMIERYDPVAGAWTTGASPATVRSQTEVVLLPDGRVLAAGGFWESGAGSPADDGWPAMPTADLYDPALDAWRNVADMSRAREYHALTVLVPDGRVITSSGGSNQASGPGTDNSVEAFEPPYLFRGPRPRIESVDETMLVRGASVDLSFSRTAIPTEVVLLGTNAVTHWVDAGVPRMVALPFRTAGDGQISIDIPSDEVELPVGWYNLFVMVDDIPSEGRIVHVSG